MMYFSSYDISVIKTFPHFISDHLWEKMCLIVVKNNTNKRINSCHFLYAKYNYTFFYFVFGVKYDLDMFLTGFCLEGLH